MPKGGHRPGAGRKPKISKVISEAVSEAVYQQFGGEKGAWKELTKRAEKNDLRLLFDILRDRADRDHGKAVQRTELAGKDGGPVKVQITTNISLPNE